MDFKQWVQKQNDEFFAITDEFFANAQGESRELIYRYASGIASGKRTNVCAGIISDCPYRVSVYRKGKKVVMQIINMKKEKRGIAICHEDDTFDPAIGIAYAWARYKGEFIIIDECLANLKNGDRFIDSDNKYYYYYIGEDPRYSRYIVAVSINAESGTFVNFRKNKIVKVCRE